MYDSKMILKASLFLLFITVSFAAQAGSLGSLFEKNELLKIKVSYNITQFQADKFNLTETGLPAQLEYDGKVLQVEVLARGGGSMQCLQPQIKINFENSLSAGTVFQGFKKVKLFLNGSCNPNETNALTDKFALANYLQYRLYELISPYHFKTRLVEVTYNDTSGKYAPYKQISFFLEPDKSIKQRLGFNRIEDEEIQTYFTQIKTKMHPSALSYANGFEGYIANFDFIIPGFYSPTNDDLNLAFAKNVNIYQDANGYFYPFIYDFDYSRMNYNPGHACWLTINVLDQLGDFSARCLEANAIKAMKKDLTTPLRNAELESAPAIKKAQETWQVLYKNEIKSLGQIYQDERTMHINSFMKAVATKKN